MNSTEVKQTKLDAEWLKSFVADHHVEMRARLEKHLKENKVINRMFDVIAGEIIDFGLKLGDDHLKDYGIFPESFFSEDGNGRIENDEAIAPWGLVLRVVLKELQARGVNIAEHIRILHDYDEPHALHFSVDGYLPGGRDFHKAVTGYNGQQMLDMLEELDIATFATDAIPLPERTFEV